MLTLNVGQKLKRKYDGAVGIVQDVKLISNMVKLPEYQRAKIVWNEDHTNWTEAATSHYYNVCEIIA
jgi:hypothetical protein